MHSHLLMCYSVRSMKNELIKVLWNECTLIWRSPWYLPGGHSSTTAARLTLKGAHLPYTVQNVHVKYWFSTLVLRSHTDCRFLDRDKRVLTISPVVSSTDVHANLSYCCSFETLPKYSQLIFLRLHLIGHTCSRLGCLAHFRSRCHRKPFSSSGWQLLSHSPGTTTHYSLSHIDSEYKLHSMAQ